MNLIYVSSHHSNKDFFLHITVKKKILWSKLGLIVNKIMLQYKKQKGRSIGFILFMQHLIWQKIKLFIKLNKAVIFTVM